MMLERGANPNLQVKLVPPRCVRCAMTAATDGVLQRGADRWLVRRGAVMWRWFVTARPRRESRFAAAAVQAACTPMMMAAGTGYYGRVLGPFDHWPDFDRTGDSSPMRSLIEDCCRFAPVPGARPVLVSVRMLSAQTRQRLSLLGGKYALSLADHRLSPSRPRIQVPLNSMSACRWL